MGCRFLVVGTIVPMATWWIFSADDTMAGRNWLDTFGKAKAMNANADLDRGYEAALLIQSLSSSITATAHPTGS